MAEEINANSVSLFIHKRLWKHPIKNELYWFTNGSLDIVLKKSEDYLLANILRPKGLEYTLSEIIMYKIFDKIIENKETPFITIGLTDYEIVFLAVGTTDDKLVLKTSENEELVFVSYPFGK
jgi:hypothetical protein